MMDQLAFGAVSAGLLLSALLVVSTRNLVHAVLWLAVTLVMTAVLFVTLSAPFVAGIQILLYTGGVITLMLFGVMLTRRQDGTRIEAEVSPGRRGPALLAAAALFGVLAGALSKTPKLGATTSTVTPTEAIGHSFLTDNVLAFELLSVLLLATMIGSIAVARRHDHAAETKPVGGRREPG
ncbi:MAG: NADH-quinone oxidoreductase subunit J [Sorangiineae bacterium]|nr:NADH-quinone oxidoreductase subunit J [Polyangiaceae bacterium]MEB2321557.1 NADH-quinone oxidoreductase subunit J [Sorangiineae bacterium]